jgi:CubicO group peptidase (beta-lactamase class C family)
VLCSLSVTRALLIALPLALFLTATPSSSLSSPAPAPEQIDAIFAAVTAPGLPGLAVLVREGGRTVFARGYGVRHLRDDAKIDAATNFRLASSTKQFTAMATMLLVRDGKLAYDTRLTDVFPEFPAYGRSITIRNLLNHTSGLPDYENLMLEAQARPNSPTPIWTDTRQIHDPEVLELLEQQKATKFAPGTKWEYSNSGYVVLGLIVAKISGEPFGDFLQDRIFAPLSMRNTVAYIKGKNEVLNRAFGYSTGENRLWRETDQSSTSATLGDGGIYSSLDDLAKWDQALRDHTLLGAEEMRAALTPVLAPQGEPTGPEGEPAAYGFGWFLNPYKGHSRMWHDGDTMGFRTTIQRFTADDLTIVVLSNRTDLDPRALADRVADLFFAAQN